MSSASQTGVVVAGHAGATSHHRDDTPQRAAAATTPAPESVPPNPPARRHMVDLVVAHGGPLRDRQPKCPFCRAPFSRGPLRANVMLQHCIELVQERNKAIIALPNFVPTPNNDTFAANIECCVCLGILKHPATLPCDHSCCLVCLTQIQSHAAVQSIASENARTPGASTGQEAEELSQPQHVASADLRTMPLTPAASQSTLSRQVDYSLPRSIRVLMAVLLFTVVRQRASPLYQCCRVLTSSYCCRRLLSCGFFMVK